MTTPQQLINFAPSTSANFQFQATIDGQVYTCICTFNAYAQRYYLSVYDLTQTLVFSRPLVASPDEFNINLAGGYFTDTVVFRDSSQVIEIPGLPYTSLSRPPVPAPAPPPPPPPPPPSSLLLHFDSSPAVDSSANAIPVYMSGLSSISTSIYKFGPGALHLPFDSGSGTYISVDSGFIQPGAQDFTVDCWIYPIGLTGQQFLFDSRTGEQQYNGIAIYTRNGAIYWDDGINEYGSTSLLTEATWNHVELGRKSGVAYLFIDGNLVLTTANVGGFFLSHLWVIGAAQYTPPGVNQSIGYIDEVHMLMGTCLHTSSFTPPSAPYAN